MSIDSPTFKNGMRQLTAAVSLITTTDTAGERSGFTATAVASVSAEPPTLLVCINRQNGSYEAIRQGGHLAVNVLSTADQHLSHRFAGGVMGGERFLEGQWDVLLSGSPILQTALVSFDCKVINLIDAGTHAVAIAEVIAIAQHPSANPALLYRDGAYCTPCNLPELPE